MPAFFVFLLTEQGLFLEFQNYSQFSLAVQRGVKLFNRFTLYLAQKILDHHRLRELGLHLKIKKKCIYIYNNNNNFQ